MEILAFEQVQFIRQQKALLQEIDRIKRGGKESDAEHDLR